MNKKTRKKIDSMAEQMDRMCEKLDRIYIMLVTREEVKRQLEARENK